MILLTLLDLSATFDTVNHTILLARLEKLFGITGNALQWITSYLTGRSQYVSLKGAKSQPTSLDCCIPQGSLLGSGFYVDYTSPLGKLLLLLLFIFHFYADDSQLQRSVNPNNEEEQLEIISNVERNIEKIGQWMHDNKLKLNSEKTEFLTIGLPKQQEKMVVKEIILEGEIIKSVDSVRNLGVMTDSCLNMKYHISYITKVCFMQLRNIRKIRRFLTTDATKKLVQAFVISRIDYCNSLFFNINEKDVDKLQRIQNAAARVITLKSKYDSITPSMKDLHWLKVRQRVKYKILTITFKVLHECQLVYLRNLLQWSQKPINVRSNHQHKLLEPRYKLESGGGRSFSVCAPRLWNKLPLDLRTCESLPAFKSQLKTFLFRECYEL